MPKILSAFFKKMPVGNTSAVFSDSGMQIFNKIKQFFVSVFSIFHKVIDRLYGKYTQFANQFKKAAPKEKFRMIRKPFFLFIGIVMLIILIPNLFPPGISTTFPENSGANVPLDGKIEVIFNREMMTRSVERGFRINPPVTGSFAWENNQKLIFTPSQPYKRGTHYTVRINGFSFSRFLIPLFTPYMFGFDTVGNQRVVVASPSDEALTNLNPVTVIFDRAMIPLTTATNSALKQPAFTISPPITGEGRWLGTTAYQFRPTENYTLATTYTVTVPNGIPAQNGGQLENGYSWTFSSEKPRIVDVSPANSEMFVSPTASVAAFFNMDMSRDSVTSNFIVYDNHDNKVEGKTVVNGNIAGFYPSQPLKRNQTYVAIVSRGVRGTEGPNGSEADERWNFTIAPLPRIIGTKPSDQSKNVLEQNAVTVDFVSPMDKTSFDGNVTVNPAPDLPPSFNTYDYNGVHELTIGTYLGRSQHYTITIAPNVKDQNGTPLGYAYTFSFDTAPYQPSLTIQPTNTYFGSFNQQVIPRIVTQVINSNTLSYSLYRLSKNDLLTLYRRRYEDECGSDQACADWQSYDYSSLTLVRKWNETFTADKNTPIDVVTKVIGADGNNIPAGFYFLNIAIPEGPHDNMVMIVSKSTVTVKRSDSQLFVWSVNQSDSNVNPDMHIQLTDSSGTVLTEGTTNSDGVFKKDINLFQKNTLFVWGNTGDDAVVASSTWNNGIDIYDFGMPRYYNTNVSQDYEVQQTVKQFLTVDRPIYRPGQKVYFKGVVRKDTDGAYSSISPGTPISVEVTDANSRSVYKKVLKLSSFGSFADAIAISKNADLGNYSITSIYNGNTYTQQFQVEEYKKQDLQVSVSPSKDNYMQADTATIGVNASYYFGAAVNNAPLTWTVQTQDAVFSWDKDVNFEFGDPDSYWNLPWYGNASGGNGSVVTSGKGTTNTHGDFTISLPLDIAKFKTSQKYIVEATVNDNNNQSIAASHEFTIHKAALYAGIKPTSYGSSVNQPASVDIVTVDYKGNEAGNTPITVNFYKRTWDTVREKDPDTGIFYFTSKAHDTLAKTTSVTTNTLGRGNATFTPSDGGTYKVTATVTDKSGNTNISGSFLWVWGDTFTTQQENNDRIVVVTDKQNYSVGDSMSVFVASPFASSSAKTLLTAERGSVLDYKVVDTNSSSNNFSLTANPNYAPNTFIGAVLVKGGNDVKNPAQFKIGYAPIKVTDPKKQVIVTINTDKKRYKPQDKLHAVISTKDLNGNPVASEVAVGLVDKAVWDLAQIELPDIYKSFYEPRNLSVSTAQLLTISIDRVNANTNLGAKGGSGGGCFTGDTPVLMSDNTAKPIKDIKIGDNVLTRESDTSPKLVPANVTQVYKHTVDRYLIINHLVKVTPEHKMYINGKWMVAGDIVRGDWLLNNKNNRITVTSVEQITGAFDVYNLKIEQYHTYFANGIYVHNDKGAPDTSRSNFPDTAYWNPSVVTGQDGTAVVDISLPDNLTTWRLAAMANTPVDAFGSSNVNVIVSRDLLIRPFLPRFLRNGDNSKLGAIIVNTSGSDQNITASIQADGIKILEDNAKQATISDGSQVKMLWSTTALNTNSGKITLSVHNTDNSLKDSVVMKLPVYSFSVPETVATAGKAQSYAQETITLPKEVDKSQGNASISMSPALGASGLSSLSYLQDYPYFCSEQTSSKMLPAVYVYHILQTHNLASIGEVNKDSLSVMINDTIQRLNKLQHPDGGWGWWTEFESNPFISAYAYEGLLAAKNEQFVVSNQVLQMAESYLIATLALPKDKVDDNTRAYILYVLKNRANILGAYADNLYDKRFSLSTESRAYLANAMQFIPGERGKGTRLVRDLISLVKKTATTSHWENNSTLSYTLSGNVSTTAHVLEALLNYDTNNPLIFEAIRYLLTTRSDNHWPSTFDSASAIKALANTVNATSANHVKETYKADVKGITMSSGTFTDKDIVSIVAKSLPITDFAIPGNTNVQFAKSGSGNLYYNINLNYFLPFSQIAPLDQGMVVVRDFVDQDDHILSKTTVKQDTEIWERLTIAAPDSRNFVAIEDMLPAGMESVNESLKNVSTLNINKPKVQQGSEQLYFNHTEYHDDRTSLFAEYLPAGVYEYTYRIRASVPGTYHFLPARAYEMYTPDVSGHSDGDWITIQ